MNPDLPEIDWIPASEEEQRVAQEKMRIHNEVYYPEYYGRQYKENN